MLLDKLKKYHRDYETTNNRFEKLEDLYENKGWLYVSWPGSYSDSIYAIYDVINCGNAITTNCFVFDSKISRTQRWANYVIK